MTPSLGGGSGGGSPSAVILGVGPEPVAQPPNVPFDDANLNLGISSPLIYSAQVNDGQGGWVQDAAMYVNIQYHSSNDAGDILPQAPSQWVGWNFLRDSQSIQTESHFGCVDYVPAGGHAGPQVSAFASSGDELFAVRLAGYYAVIRLDGTASCVVSAPGGIIPTDLTPGTYNVDSSMLDWANATVLGTDLAGDADNNQIHSTAGGLMWIFSTLALWRLGGDPIG